MSIVELKQTHEIHRALNANETALAVLEELALRERNTAAVDLRRLRVKLVTQGKKIDADELVQLFKQLERYGVGKLILSARGNPLKFKWNFSLKSVADIGTTPVVLPKITQVKTTVQTSKQLAPSVIVIGLESAFTKELVKRIDIDTLMQLVDNKSRG